MSAPAPPSTTPDPGRVWVRSDSLPSNWQVGAEGRECRFTVGPGHRECRRPAVARVKRGTLQWWAYCADHLYGQVLHDGVLWRQVAQP